MHLLITNLCKTFAVQMWENSESENILKFSRSTTHEKIIHLSTIGYCTLWMLGFKKLLSYICSQIIHYKLVTDLIKFFNEVSIWLHCMLQNVWQLLCNAMLKRPIQHKLTNNEKVLYWNTCYAILSQSMWKKRHSNST